MSKVNRYLLSTLVLLLMVSPRAFSQSAACMGLKNPTSFAAYNNAQFGRYSGATGTVQNQAATAVNPGMTFSNTVSAANLATVVCGNTSYCYSSITSVAPSDYSNRFVIKTAGMDPVTNNRLSYLPPDSSYTSSIRVGNYCGNTEAEALCYDIRVSSENALLFIWYAINLENSLHGAADNPKFGIRVKKKVGNTYQIISDTLCYTVASPNSGQTNISPFHAIYDGGTTAHSGDRAIYKPWAKVAINLYKYLYQDIRVEIVTGDCAYTAHYGLCYIAGECQPMRLIANGCAAGSSEAVATIKAPKGLESYQWYKCNVNTGITTSDSLNQFEPIQNANDSILQVVSGDFVMGNTVLDQRTFLCRMVSYMDPTKPIYSNLICNVGNMKPTISIDSILFCDGDVELTDKSYVKFTDNDDNNRVDTSITQWTFYTSPSPNDNPDEVLTGGTVRHHFRGAGDHSVVVRVSAYDTTCWNEKTVTVRSLAYPDPSINIPRNDLCMGDEITLIDNTPAPVTWRQWIIHHDNGSSDTSTVVGAGFMHAYDSTEIVELRVRNNYSYRQDTNNDGVIETIYCEASTFDTVRVGGFAEMQVTGDTIVCLGTQAVVNVTSDIPGCNYEWYHTLNGTTPFQSGATLTDSPTADMRYYVKSITPNGCESWDSMNIYIVEPQLEAPVVQMCEGDQVNLYASDAYSFTWSSMPNDPSLAGQENEPTITVSPSQTTTYTLVGHGMNNCDANPLTKTITVYPYPIPTFEMSPGFVDSEEPVVTFRDMSPNSVSSLWDFGSGNTSTERQVVHTFTDLTQDSIQVSLTTGNELGCTADTSFYVPVSLFAVWFPNAITPTLGSNRTFKVFTHNQLEYYSLYIYNRAGELVFFSHDQNEEWDGKYKGEYCDQGVYVYACSYRRPGTVDIVTKKGTVLLIQ